MNTNASYPFETLKIDWPKDKKSRFGPLKFGGKIYGKTGFAGKKLLFDRSSCPFYIVPNASHATEQTIQIEKTLEPVTSKIEEKQTFATFPKEIKRKQEAEKIAEKFEESPAKKAKKLYEIQKTIFDDFNSK